MNEFHKENLAKKLNQHISIVVNEEQGVALFAFRGTEMDMARLEHIIVAWMNNFDLVRTDFTYLPNCGALHKGFFKTFESTESLVNTQVSKFVRANYRIIFTGHSLGGGLANIAGMRYMSLYANHASKMEVITFGAPAGLGNRQFAECYRNIVGNSATHYATAYDSKTQDIVSTLSPKWLGYVRNAGKRFYVRCNPKYFGNPNKIPDTDIGGPSLVPKAIGCHYQQSYMDGLLYEEIRDTPLSEMEEFFMILSQ